MITFHCEICGQKIAASDEDADTQGTCPGCNCLLIVPGPESLAQPTILDPISPSQESDAPNASPPLRPPLDENKLGRREPLKAVCQLACVPVGFGLPMLIGLLLEKWHVHTGATTGKVIASLGFIASVSLWGAVDRIFKARAILAKQAEDRK
jgi:hypothetical protein